MIGIDTNVLVRYLVQDDASQAAIANRLVEHTLGPEKPGFISGIVLCELVWVLESAYGYDRAQVADALHRLFEVDRLRLEAPALAWRALDAYRVGVDFSDALIALVNEQSGCEYTASFDRRAARLDQTRLLKR
jgi:predicted nucleic-acid-binding protein